MKKRLHYFHGYDNNNTSLAVYYFFLALILLRIVFVTSTKTNILNSLDHQQHDTNTDNTTGNATMKRGYQWHVNAEKIKWQNKCTEYKWSLEKGCNISALLQTLLDGYDKRLRPLMDFQHPVLVTVGFWILSIDSINVIDMDYQIDFFFRQSWTDGRLKHSYPQTLTLSNSMLDRIWVPDTYFENSKNSHFHSVTVPNKMLKIKPDGTVLYNARISVRASCPMDLRMFPMDSQECNLNIESYGYSVRDIRFQWEKDKQKRLSIGTKVRTLPQYNLTQFNTSNSTEAYVIGNFSRLTAIFVLQRRTGYFFLHLYAPCALIVMISWISFCIPKDSTAARVALGITSVLTITTILNMLNTAMPKVSYIKAVDWYLIVSFLFVFAVLIEYTLVLYLTDKEKQTREEKNKNKYKKKRSDRPDEKQYVGTNGHVKDRSHHELRSRSFTNNNYKETHFECSDKESTSFQSKPLIVVLEEKHLGDGGHHNSSHHHHRQHNDEDHSASLQTHAGKFLCEFRVDVIDEYSRMIFPLAFVIFNIVYWLLFYSKKNEK